MPCSIPAERAHFMFSNCHPCSRIVWNWQVLNQEEEHKGQHQRGECECEVIFDAEERDRRRGIVAIHSAPNSNEKASEQMAERAQIMNTQGYNVVSQQRAKNSESFEASKNIAATPPDQKNQDKQHRHQQVETNIRQARHHERHLKEHHRQSNHTQHGSRNHKQDRQARAIVPQVCRCSSPQTPRGSSSSHTQLHQSTKNPSETLQNISCPHNGSSMVFHPVKPGEMLAPVQVSLNHGFKWFPGSGLLDASGIILPPLPPPLQCYRRDVNTSKIRQSTDMAQQAHIASEPTPQRSQKVSPRTVADSISDSSSQE